MGKLIIVQKKTKGENIKSLCADCSTVTGEGKYYILKETEETKQNLVLRKKELVICPKCKIKQEVPAFFSSLEKARSARMHIEWFGVGDSRFFPVREAVGIKL